MLRHIIVMALMAAASPAWAEVRPAPTQTSDDQNAQTPSDDRFVVSGDECGASRYRHLLGRDWAQVYQAALAPADSAVQNRPRMRTLEYRPQQLNIVVDGTGRIIAIGCF
jgi:hypothetical protein